MKILVVEDDRMLLTSKSAQNRMVEGLKAGADDYLIKPFERSLKRMRRFRF
jgi:DNA-binding response OmpR family regulator